MSSFLENLVRRGMGEAPELEGSSVLPAPEAPGEPGGEPELPDWEEETIEVPVARTVAKNDAGVAAPSVDSAQRRPAPAVPAAVRPSGPVEMRHTENTGAGRTGDRPQASRRDAEPARPEPASSPVIREPASTPEEPAPRSIPQVHVEPLSPAVPEPIMKDTGGPVTVPETSHASRPPQAARFEANQEQPPRIIETTIIQPVSGLTPESRVIERIETRLERQERIVENLTEHQIEREVQREPFDERIEREAQVTSPPIQPSPDRREAQKEEDLRQPGKATMPAPAQPPVPARRSLVKPTPATARAPEPALATSRRAPLIERKVEVRIGTIEVRANAPASPAASRVIEERPATEDFSSYRGLRDFSGWFRG